MKFNQLIELEVKEQIKYLNSRLDDGLSVKEIREVLCVGEKKLQKHLKSINYKYDQKLKNYILVTSVVNKDSGRSNNYKDNIKVVNDDNEANTKVEVLDINLEEYDKVLSMSKKFEEMNSKFEEMYKWYELQNSVIDITPPKLEIPPNDKDPISRSFKIYPDVMEEFSAFCRANNNYKVQDIISHAMREFLDKYKK